MKQKESILTARNVNHLIAVLEVLENAVDSYHEHSRKHVAVLNNNSSKGRSHHVK